MPLPAKRLIFASLSMLAVSATATAQSNPSGQYAGEFERPYGFAYGEEERTYNANTRDARGNRVIIDGRIVVGDDFSTLSQSGVYGNSFYSAGTAFSNSSTFSSSTSSSSSSSSNSQFSGAGLNAIGNQLNVITIGDYNNVVIDSEQVNNGDQNVVLNGELNLDD